MKHHADRTEYQRELYSSATTLGDMEIFVFPDLMYSLVLANIMSPRIWRWKEDSWFRKLDKMNPYRKIQRLKQFIMDHYEFNLDLDTWGLTDKDTELARFKDFIDLDILEQSNALFGYEGDKYYFDLDIRKHFGLDKYEGDVIPYWKTETVEAMDAFRFKDAYRMGAGECVSLSALYAAALYVICEIPLEDIFLVATPLHSQNYVLVNDGVITNNRRIVTKTMWYNGTELTNKAQRALRNEQVTIVAHPTGHIHVMYPEASIDPKEYDRFGKHLDGFLNTAIDFTALTSFLREHSQLQKCFQVAQEYHGSTRYVAAEKVYSAEHGSSFRVSDNTRDKLLDELDELHFYPEAIEGRIILNHFEEFFKKNRIDIFKQTDYDKLMQEFSCVCTRTMDIGAALRDFVRIEARLPSTDKEWISPKPILLEPGIPREEVISTLDSLRDTHVVADLAFYAGRDLSRSEWEPFAHACLARNPVVVKATASQTDEALPEFFRSLAGESIYDEGRLAQPDEVWNFQRGDGVECAIALANCWLARHPDSAVTLKVEPDAVHLTIAGDTHTFSSRKGLRASIDLTAAR